MGNTEATQCCKPKEEKRSKLKYSEVSGSKASKHTSSCIVFELNTVLVVLEGNMNF